MNGRVGRLFVVLLASGCVAEPATMVQCEPATSEAAITIDQLVIDLGDLDNLVTRPADSFVSGMQSSHNPVSIDPLDLQTWHANSDRGHYLRDDGEEHVLFEQQGSGVVTRIWSANPSGVLRVYVDDQLALQAPMKDLLSGRVAPFTEPWAFTAALGSNFYFPIPFAGSCRITSTASDPLFFQISYRSYRGEPSVETFTMAEAEAAICRHQAVADALVTPPRLEAGVDDPGTRGDVLEVLEPGGALTLDAPAFEGGSIIRALKVVIDSAEAIDVRSLWLTLTFDGRATVETPAIDFFGTGPEINAAASLSTSVDPTGELISAWPMPFRERAVIQARNSGATPVSLHVSVLVEPFEWRDGDRYFHASWHAPDQVRTDARRDWAAARLEGEGVLVGTVLNVANPSPAWWGEGDERIYVDGEALPSFAGTGTEDFFGFAWCSTETYSTAFIGQTVATPESNWGRISMYRWLVADPIPFTTSLDFDWEISHWREGNDAVDVFYDAAFFWYGDLESDDANATRSLADETWSTSPVTTERPPANRPELVNYRCRP